MKLLPGLAAELPQISSDGKIYTIKLRTNVKFQDGEPFNAAAMKYSLERVQGKQGLAAGVLSFLLANLTDIQAVDDSTLRLTLAQKSASFVYNLTHIQFSAVSPKAAQAAGAAGFGRKPIGTGPFLVDSWQPGQQLTLLRNPNYWQAAPKLSKAIYKFLPDPATRVVALESGQIDALITVNEDDYDRLKSNSKLNVSVDPTLRSYSFMFTSSIAPLNDVAVRRAFASAVDTKGLSKSLLKGLHAPADRVGYPLGITGITKNATAFTYDLEKAKQTLDAAGWKVGGDGIREKDGKKLKFDLWTTTGLAPKDSLITESVTQTLRTIGMDVATKTLEFAAYREKLTKKELPAYSLSAGTSTGDIDFLAGLFWQPPSAWVTAVTPEITGYVTAAQGELDPQAREKIYDKLWDALYREALLVPVYWMSGINATSTKVHGFKVAPTEVFRLADVTVD